MSNKVRTVSTDKANITDIDQANTLFQNIKESTDRINKIVAQDSSTNGVRVGRYKTDDRRSVVPISETPVIYAVLFIAVISLILSIILQVEIIKVHAHIEQLSTVVTTVSEQQSLAISQPSQSSVK